MLLSAVALGLVAIDGTVSRLDAVVLIGGTICYLLFRWKSLQDDGDYDNPASSANPQSSPFLHWPHCPLVQTCL
jgi:hypothetical protein